MVTRPITTFTLKTSPDGSWSIPEDILEELGVKPGDTIVADRTHTGQVILRSPSPTVIDASSALARSAARIRTLVQNPLPPGTSIEEELEEWDNAIGEAIVADYEASLHRESSDDA